ncbi:MAG TPA: hypothetical protein VJO33_04405 [Gemmatimonadaceae bacterium]|nr:hypothetical protein [Gemmatimonadaceae bacterium]
MTFRSLTAAVAVFAIGCLKPPITAPTPLSFQAAKAPNQATQVAAVALMNAGFRVAQSDARGNALIANRTATHNGNEDYIWCKYPKESGAAANRETTLFITFTAKPTTNGSDVTIGGTVHTSYPGYQGTAMEIVPNDSDCVSNGVMEKQLETVLK